MGKIEIESRKRSRNRNIQKIILQSIAAAGLLSVALVAPNSLKLLKDLGILPKRRQREIIRASRDRLVKHGLLFRNEKGYLRLTAKGEAKLRQLELCDFKLKFPKRWDKKWRVLIFDISTKKRGLRDKVRNTLKTIGFYKLQHSVWVFPHSCEDLITLLKADFKIGDDLIYMIVDSIENDKKVRDHFYLKQ